MNFRSLTLTLAASFLFLSIVALAVNSSLNIYCDYRAQQKNISESLQLVSQNAADDILNYINRNFSILESSARLVQMNDDEQKLKQVLDKLLSLEPSFHKLVFLNAQEQELATTSRLIDYKSPPLCELADQDLIAVLQEGRKFLSPIYIDQITLDPMVLMSVPITNFFGGFQGALVVETNLQFIWDVVADMKVGQHGLAFVIDQQGYLIAFKDINQVLKKENIVELEEVKKTLFGQKPLMNKAGISKGLSGPRVISAHTLLENLNCAVVVESPFFEAYRSSWLVIRLTLASILMTLVIAVMIGFFVSKKITRPIMKLRDALAKVGKGDFDANITIQSRNEIGEMAENFNRMIDNIKKTTVSKNQFIEEMHQREKIEADLQDAKKAAEIASEVKSRFLSNMSHEIRTPINAIVGFTELLKRSSLDETQSSYLSFIHESANNLLVIINDILDLSKIEANQLQFDDIEFNFTDILENIFTTARSKLMEKTVDLVYTINEGTPVHYKGDPARISQIFINLIDNACKFTEKGEIVVTLGLDRTDRFETSRNGEFRMLRISIRDTGIGIPDDKKEIIFDSFSQADTSDTRHYGGTGLGLTITKAFVEKMGGRIWMESKCGEGSEFIFLLRLKQVK